MSQLIGKRARTPPLVVPTRTPSYGHDSLESQGATTEEEQEEHYVSESDAQTGNATRGLSVAPTTPVADAIEPALKRRKIRDVSEGASQPELDAPRPWISPPESGEPSAIDAEQSSSPVPWRLSPPPVLLEFVAIPEQDPFLPNAEDGSGMRDGSVVDTIPVTGAEATASPSNLEAQAQELPSASLSNPSPFAAEQSTASRVLSPTFASLPLSRGAEVLVEEFPFPEGVDNPSGVDVQGDGEDEVAYQVDTSEQGLVPDQDAEGSSCSSAALITESLPERRAPTDASVAPNQHNTATAESSPLMTYTFPASSLATPPTSPQCEGSAQRGAPGNKHTAPASMTTSPAPWSAPTQQPTPPSTPPNIHTLFTMHLTPASPAPSPIEKPRVQEVEDFETFMEAAGRTQELIEHYLTAFEAEAALISILPFTGFSEIY
ncbi:hypothetical protein DFH09DRAFT_1199176 [Mycena vulgaris]|nr:hypothetical protein DFH09DRAFT_1199176 [Mycena vulgaris]